MMRPRKNIGPKMGVGRIRHRFWNKGLGFPLAAEIVEEGRNGCLVGQPPRPEELAEKMNRALAIDRAALAALNRKALEPFDWDRNLAETLAVYQAVQAGPV